jgi:uncharacterized protein (TIGR00251 family)
VRAHDGGVTFRVRVIPRASSEGIGGERGGALVVRLTAPPVEGAGNRALQRFLAKALGVPGFAVKLLRGMSGREKVVRVEGVSIEEIWSLLPGRRA